MITNHYESQNKKDKKENKQRSYMEQCTQQLVGGECVDGMILNHYGSQNKKDRKQTNNYLTWRSAHKAPVSDW